MAEKHFLGGVTNTTLHIESDGTTHIEEKQDCETILEANAAERNHRFSAASPEGGIYGHARVPIVILLQWAREAGLGNNIYGREFEPVMEKKLLDPQYAKFLIAPTLRDPHIIIKGAR